MKCDVALAELRAQADALRRRGVTALYLFGSTARGDAGDRSDIDLFIDYDKSRKFSLIDLVATQHFIEDRLKAKVDLGTRDGLDPAMRDRVLAEAIRVF